LPLAKGISKGRPAGGPRQEPDALLLPANARWFARRLSTMRGAQILEIVTALDEKMNNTSLILLFEFGGREAALSRRCPARELALRAAGGG